MFNHRKFKSSVEKRMELINLVLDSGWMGAVEEWLEIKNIDIEQLTDNEIDKLLWMIKETNEPKNS